MQMTLYHNDKRLNTSGNEIFEFSSKNPFVHDVCMYVSVGMPW